MVRGGEDHAFHAVLPGRLEEIVSAHDIGVQNCLPGRFGGQPAEMHNPLGARNGAFDGACVRQIRGDERLGSVLAAQGRKAERDR